MGSRPAVRASLAFLGYTGLALLFTYPVVVQLGSHLAGTGDDPWIFL